MSAVSLEVVFGLGVLLRLRRLRLNDSIQIDNVRLLIWQCA